MAEPIRILLGFLLGPAVGAAAWRAGALTASGAWAAALVGASVFGFGGWAWAGGLLAFFVSSSLLSRLFTRRKAAANEKYAKGSQRDWGQVAANGGLAALLALLHFLLPGAGWPWPAFLGALAAVNADTWATELGALSRRPPRLITTGRIVEAGTSGGVSTAGVLASVAGAAFVGSLGLSAADAGVVLAAAVLGGLGGSLFDSLLGATVQAIYFCPTDGKETEQHPLHSCGAPTRLLRGWAWLNNDLVNFLASVFGSGVSILAWRLLVVFMP